MKKKRLVSLLVLILVLALTASTVYAQTYLFRVDRVVVNFFVNEDGTASVEYTYDFTNDNSASPIDFVDIGLPNDNYDLGSITADIDGKPINDIQRSEYVDHGIALGLGANAIPPGRSGQVHAWIPVINKVIYPSNKQGEENYASVQFSPNYFGSEYVQGSTDMTVTIILPPGVDENNGRWYPPEGWPGNDQPESGFTDQNRVFYTWVSPNASSAREYVFGAGFPIELVPEAAIVRGPSFQFDFTYLCCFGFVALFGGMIWFGVRQGRKRKLAYLPPKIAVEGHGVKRGLTAVEAAILMQQPMDKILTMILFAVVKKGAARVDKRDPLEIAIANPLPEGLQPYEEGFIKAFQTGSARERKTRLQDVMVGLVKSITEKMRGFSRKETVDYYDSIMKQAWAQVEAAETPEVKSAKYDEVMDWTMLDREYPERTREVFRTGPVFLPHWWGNYDPVFRAGQNRPAGMGVPSAGGSSGGGRIEMPNLPGSEFAASVVNSVQDFSSGVIGDLMGFTGAVTDKTNPPPPPPKSTYRGGGGGGGGRSCACACACAGCACACAGGGR